MLTLRLCALDWNNKKKKQKTKKQGSNFNE